jgi:hypothetical protein
VFLHFVPTVCFYKFCPKFSLHNVPKTYLGGAGIESRWEARFSALVQTGSDAHQAFYTMGAGSFPGLRRPGLGLDHKHPYNADIKERI